MAEQRFDFLKDLVATVPDVQGEEENLAETPRVSSSHNPFTFPASASSSNSGGSSVHLSMPPDHHEVTPSQAYDLSGGSRRLHIYGSGSNPSHVEHDQHEVGPDQPSYLPSTGSTSGFQTGVPAYNVPPSPGIGFYQDSLETQTYGQQQQQHPLALITSGSPYASPNQTSYPSPSSVGHNHSFQLSETRQYNSTTFCLSVFVFFI